MRSTCGQYFPGLVWLDRAWAEVLERLRRLWESRVDAVNRERAAGIVSTELRHFGWWFISGKFPSDWSLQQLEAALRQSRTVDPAHLIAERLAELAPAFPLQSISCLKLLIEGDTKGWHTSMWLENARKVLVMAASGPDELARRAAMETVNLLVARGHYDFRNVMSG